MRKPFSLKEIAEKMDTKLYSKVKPGEKGDENSNAGPFKNRKNRAMKQQGKGFRK